MMRKKSWSWRLVASLGVLSVAVLGSGLWMALTNSGGDGTANASVGSAEAQPATQTSNTNVAAKAATAQAMATGQPFNIVALGDSLTQGVGDPSGKGYVGDLKDLLEKAGEHVNVQNFGISGLEAPELVKSVASPGMNTTLKNAQYVMISIGGNDITHSIGNIGQLLQTNDIDEKKIQAAQVAYTKNLKTILQTVRQENPKSPILLIGLYNPFEGLFADDAKSNRLLLDWNANVTQIAQSFPNVKVIPTFDIFQWNTDHLLSVDHFHPNQEGYEKMAQRIVQSMPTMTAPSTQAK